MRYFIALAVLIAGTVGGTLVYRELTRGLPVVLPRPSQVELSAGNAPILPGGWTNSGSLTFSAKLHTAVRAGLDVEVRPWGDAFTNSPTASNSATEAALVCPNGSFCRGRSPGTAANDPAILVHLNDGSYHWQLRLRNDHGLSPWVAYHGVINVDTHPPVAPQVISPTNPNPKKVYHSGNMLFTWHSSDEGSGIAGYAYRLDTDPHGTPKPELRTSSTSVRLVGLDTGTYYFHVSARDNAGNWSASSTFPVHIDVTPPGLAHVRFSRFQFDPQYRALRISFAVTRAATTTRVGVYRQSDNQLIRLYTLGHLAQGQSTAVWWDGKNARGQLVGSGSYAIYIRAIDHYGHSSVAGWRDFVVDYKRIVVSLSQQKLVAYDGNRVVLTSLVTTGNRALPTPVGTFYIMGKFHPFTFRSPWPKSSRFYYPPSKVQYAMLFQEGGYFIHDAPWRSAFGPGTNAGVGTPGSNYTGTHGCVNAPPDVALRLYNWTRIGTVVQVVR